MNRESEQDIFTLLILDFGESFTLSYLHAFE